jgi:hypothetical protein
MSETITIIELGSAKLPQLEPVFVPSTSPLPSSRLSSEETLDSIALAQTSAVNPSRIPDISRWQSTAIIATVACATMINAMLSGLLVVGLPTMAKDLKLDGGLLLWPASVNAYVFLFPQTLTCCIFTPPLSSC